MYSTMKVKKIEMEVIWPRQEVKRPQNWKFQNNILYRVCLALQIEQVGWFLFCWVGFSNIYMHFKVPVWHWSHHDLHLTSNDLKKHNFAIFEPISLFSTPKCSKFNPNFELEVKCGSYKAKFNWRSKLLTLPYLNPVLRIQTDLFGSVSFWSAGSGSR